LFNFFRDDFRQKKDKNYRFGDFCSGSGIIALLLSQEYSEVSVEGIEIQEDLYQAALNSVPKEQARLSFRCNDLTKYKDFLPPNSYDVILSNPPYRKLQKGRLNKNPSHILANHEVSITLTQLLEAVRYGINPLGSFYCSYHPSRGDELLAELMALDLKPMTMRTVHPDKNSEAVILLVKSVFKGKNELSVLPPLFLDEVSKEDYR